MVNTGQYWVMAFDDKGRRDKRFDQEADSYSVAVDVANGLLKAGDVGSFVISRVLYNSLDKPRERWDTNAPTYQL